MTTPRHQGALKLKEAFQVWDSTGTGVIPRHSLERVVSSLAPSLSAPGLSVLLDAAETSGGINYCLFLDLIYGAAHGEDHKHHSYILLQELARPRDGSDVSDSLDTAVAEVVRLRGLLASLSMYSLLTTPCVGDAFGDVPPKTPECRLRIIHVNDVYSLENFPRLKACIDTHRKSCRNLFVTLAGDFLAPYLLSSLDQGVGMVDCLNRVGIDILCFGNHESDVPYEALENRIAEFKGVWLNSNMPEFLPRLPESHVVNLVGEDGTPSARVVGFMGLLIGGGKFASTYREDAMGGAAASIIPVLEAHGAVTSRIHAQHPNCDAVVPLTHQDQAEDERLAAMDMYPVILAGHDHEVTNVSIKGCPVVKAGQDAINAAVVDMLWLAGSPRKARPQVSVRFERMQDYPPDPELPMTVDRWMAPVHELEVATIAHLEPAVLAELPGGVLSSKDTRFGPSSMASFLATAIRANEHAEVAVINGGAVRGEKEYSVEITYADLKNECPFPSENVVAKISGRTLATAVRESRAPWLEPGGPKEASSALHIDSGCVCTLEESGWELTSVNGEMLQPDRLYTVVCDSYDLKKLSALSSWAAEHPELIPPADAGRPTLPILVEYFCNAMWRTIVDENGDGQVEGAEIEALFLSSEGLKGELTIEEITAALQKKLGSGSSIIARQMIAVADKDGSGTVTKEELFSHLLKGRRERKRTSNQSQINSRSLPITPAGAAANSITLV